MKTRRFRTVLHLLGTPEFWGPVLFLVLVTVLVTLAGCQRRICVPATHAMEYITEDGRTVVILIVDEASDKDNPYMIHSIVPGEFD